MLHPVQRTTCLHAARLSMHALVLVNLMWGRWGPAAAGPACHVVISAAPAAAGSSGWWARCGHGASASQKVAACEQK